MLAEPHTEDHKESIQASNEGVLTFKNTQEKTRQQLDLLSKHPLLNQQPSTSRRVSASQNSAQMMPRSDPSPDSELSHSSMPKDVHLVADASGSRVWRACLPCRRKKVKCDGKQPCYNCSSRDQDCGFPDSKDNASASRHYATSFEARCQQMTSLCERLENLSTQLSHSIEMLNNADSTASTGPHADKAQADLLRAAQVLRSMPELRDAAQNPSHQFSHQSLDNTSPHDINALIRPNQIVEPAEQPSDLEDDDLESLDGNPEDDIATQNTRRLGGVGALVRDSYGYLRFVGGSSNSMLIDAAVSASPNTTGPSPLVPESGSGRDERDREHADIPIFVRGKVWPELPFLPRPDQLTRPPQYIADLLLNLYFDQLHYTFPVVYKPHFMKRYRLMFRPGSDSAKQTHPTDRRFLLVFYAICACASSLLPHASDAGFPGIEYYEKSLLLYYASTGEASLERVQGLALLSLCAAGWNTLTQSWTLAGQAVRAAQDIGIHLSNRLMLSSNPILSRSDLLDQHISRRVWWSVYTLDRTTSICLGRPMAAHDEDCDWEMPLNMSDEELDSKFGSDGSGNNNFFSTPSSPSTTGFLAFARLCRISGKVQQLSAPHRLRELTSPDLSRSERFVARVSAYDGALQKWLDNLPDSIRFSANKASSEGGGKQDLVMCVVSFIVHAGSLLNLHRCLIGHSRQASTATLPRGINAADCVVQCKSAARSCINAAEMVRDLIPPSHYLAICVHYLTLSGVVLLRLPSDQQYRLEVIADVEKCAGFLKDLEQRWTGAARSRVIVEKLLSDYRNPATRPDLQSNNPSRLAENSGGFQENNRWAESTDRRGFNLFEETSALDAGAEDFYFDQTLGSELFAFENPDSGLAGPWGRL